MGSHHDTTIWENICYFFPSILSKYKFFVHKVRCCSFGWYSLCLGTSAEQSITVRIHLSLYRHRDHGGHLPLRSNERVLGIRDERPFPKHRFKSRGDTGTLHFVKIDGEVIMVNSPDFGNLNKYPSIAFLSGWNNPPILTIDLNAFWTLQIFTTQFWVCVLIENTWVSYTYIHIYFFK